MPRGNAANFKKNKESINKLKSEVSTLKKSFQTSAYTKFEGNVQDLNEQVTKLVSINLTLQSKMTELLIKVTDLIRENRELISLLEEASESGAEAASGGINEESKSLFESLLVEMKKVTKNTYIMGESFKNLDSYMRKAYTKGLLSKAIGGKFEASPMPEEEGEEASLPPSEGGIRLDEL